MKTNQEETWQRARLMPVTGIGGPDEEERRGTSVLLAVLGAVREYGKAITTKMGAVLGREGQGLDPRYVIETFIDLPRRGEDERVRRRRHHQP